MPKLPLMRNSNDKQFQSFDDDDDECSFDGQALLSNYGGGDNESIASGPPSEEKPRSKSPLKRIKKFATKVMKKDDEQSEANIGEDAEIASVAASESQGGARPPSPTSSLYSDSNASASGHTAADGDDRAARKQKRKVKRRNLVSPTKNRATEGIPSVPENEAQVPPPAPAPAPGRRRPSLLGSGSLPFGFSMNGNKEARDPSRPRGRDASGGEEGASASIRSTRSNNTDRASVQRTESLQEKPGFEMRNPPPNPEQKQKDEKQAAPPVADAKTEAKSGKPKKPKGRMQRRSSFKGMMSRNESTSDDPQPVRPFSRLKRRASLNAAAPSTLASREVEPQTEKLEVQPLPEKKEPKPKARFARRSSLSAAAQTMTSDPVEEIQPAPAPRPRFARRNSLDNSGLTDPRARENAPTKSVMRRRHKSPQKRADPVKAQDIPVETQEIPVKTQEIPVNAQEPTPSPDPKPVKSRKKWQRRHSLSAAAGIAEPEPVVEVDRMSEGGKRPDIDADRMSEGGRRRDNDAVSETSKTSRSERSSSRRVARPVPGQEIDADKKEKRDMLRKHKSLRGLAGKLGKISGRSKDSPSVTGDARTVSGASRAPSRSKSASDSKSVSGELRSPSRSKSRDLLDLSASGGEFKELGQICENEVVETPSSPKTRKVASKATDVVSPPPNGEGKVLSDEARVLELLGKVGGESAASVPQKYRASSEKSPITSKPKAKQSVAAKRPGPGEEGSSSSPQNRKKGFVEQLKEESAGAGTPQSKTKGFVKQLKSEQSSRRITKGDSGSPTSVDDFDAASAPRRKKRGGAVEKSEPADRPSVEPKQVRPEKNVRIQESSPEKRTREKPMENPNDSQGFAQLSFATGEDGNGVLDVQYEDMGQV